MTCLEGDVASHWCDMWHSEWIFGRAKWAKYACHVTLQKEAMSLV